MEIEQQRTVTLHNHTQRLKDAPSLLPAFRSSQVIDLVDRTPDLAPLGILLALPWVGKNSHENPFTTRDRRGYNHVPRQH